ncbi:hypothetical protein ACFQX6_18460 [Streptosporangium lutulentum]
MLKIFADLVVYVGEDARERKARLDELDGAATSPTRRSSPARPASSPT